MSEEEYNEISEWMLNNYVQHANYLKHISCDVLAEAHLKATIRNDHEMMFLTELALNN